MAHLRSNHGDGIMVCPSAKRSLSDDEDEEEAWEPPPPLVGLDPGSHHGSRCRIAVGVLPWEPPPLGKDLAPYWRENLARSAHAAAKQEEAQRLYKHEGAKVEQPCRLGIGGRYLHDSFSTLWQQEEKDGNTGKGAGVEQRQPKEAEEANTKNIKRPADLAGRPTHQDEEATRSKETPFPREGPDIKKKRKKKYWEL